MLLVVLASLFWSASHPVGARFFRVVPLLIFAYFIPTTLSNVGIIPLQSPTYDWIKTWLLPCSLVLLTMSIDIPAILKLGKNALILFLGGTVSIMLGGPLSYFALGWMMPAEVADEAWRGLAALSGSWIGGGANFIAIGESVGASDSILGVMIVVDVAIANAWMAVLFFFAANEHRMDASLGADRGSLEEVRDRIESYHRDVARETNLADLLAMLAIAFGATVIATFIAVRLPDVGGVLGRTAWIAILVTAFGVAASFTRVRRLEGAGASRVGSLFLYLLVATIGAKAEFSRVFDAPVLLLIGAMWITIHALSMLVLRYLLKAPVFFLAVGSQANVGGAASAPIVAAAFQPELASVGALMGVAGYVLGTYAGLVTAKLLQFVDTLR